MSDYGRVQQVFIEQSGATVATAASTGDEQLEIDNAQDFDDAGGTLEVNGTRLAYTSITEGTNSDDPDVLNLADPFPSSASAAEDDAVYPVVGGIIPEDWYAVVTMGNEGDMVHCLLSVDQRPQWPVGDYDGQPVTISDDAPQRILDAPGRTVLPTTATPTLARITAYVGVNYDGAVDGMTEGTTGRSRDIPWDHVDDTISVGVGTVFLVDPTMLKFTITQPGIYAISWSAYIDDHLSDARSTTSIGLQCAPDWTDNAYDAFLRGGDQDGSSACGSFTYYLSQEQIDAGHNTVSFYLTWQDLDASNLNGNYFEAMIQQIVAADVPTTPSPPPEPGPFTLGYQGDLAVDAPTHFTNNSNSLYILVAQPDQDVAAARHGSLTSFTLGLLAGVATDLYSGFLRVVTGSLSGTTFTVTDASSSPLEFGPDPYPQTVDVDLAVNAGDLLGVWLPATTKADIGFTPDVTGSQLGYADSLSTPPAPGDVIEIIPDSSPGSLLAIQAEAI